MKFKYKSKYMLDFLILVKLCICIGFKFFGFMLIFD